MTKEISSEQKLKRNEYLINALRNHTIKGKYMYFEYGSREEFELLVTAFRRLGFRVVGTTDYIFKWNTINENYNHKALLWMSKSSMSTERNYVDWSCTRINHVTYHRKNPVKFRETIKILKEIDRKLKIDVD